MFKVQAELYSGNMIDSKNTDYERIERVIKHLDEHHLAQPSLKDLAHVAGLSESHFQRVFSRWTGTTPKSFVQFLTAQHAKDLLRKSKDILSVSLDSGLSGTSRLHDLMVSLEAVTPGEYKSKGAGVDICYGIHMSPFGLCLIGHTDRGICHLSFIDSNQEEAIAGLREKWENASFSINRAQTAKTVERIFTRSGRHPLSVLVRGTPFQVKVWEALLRIPEGAVISYEGLAKGVGSPRAARAVGSAVGQNAIAYLIPCHRVIRETGAFGNYRWGEFRKKALLTWEAVQ